MAYESPYQADVQAKYDQQQLKAAQSQVNPNDPWHDSKGNITDFGAVCGQAVPQAVPDKSVTRLELMDLQAQSMRLFVAVTDLLNRMGGR